jgi:hypothetical protein
VNLKKCIQKTKRIWFFACKMTTQGP